MTVRLHVVDPGPAAHSAKNKPTGPGLPMTAASDSERDPMVGNNAPCGLPEQWPCAVRPCPGCFGTGVKAVA
ncbi:hypothetical protein SAMN05421630_103441 [Prauserella marina]|uniref:Uncharacterized protein n=1 Tax=Prauserella marina TaxID=530584 RepID=A0A1G6P1D2_9PSEU|nr:hypothetical protein DES30_102905 [Prauserella marina]SDC74090.1 hypothetical protein SAMN05421630_103441 [Prauserella marina]